MKKRGVLLCICLLIMGCDVAFGMHSHGRGGSGGDVGAGREASNDFYSEAQRLSLVENYHKTVVKRFERDFAEYCGFRSLGSLRELLNLYHFCFTNEYFAGFMLDLHRMMYVLLCYEAIASGNSSYSCEGVEEIDRFLFQPPMMRFLVREMYSQPINPMYTYENCLKIALSFFQEHRYEFVYTVKDMLQYFHDKAHGIADKVIDSV